MCVWLHGIFLIESPWDTQSYLWFSVVQWFLVRKWTTTIHSPVYISHHRCLQFCFPSAHHSAYLIADFFLNSLSHSLSLFLFIFILLDTVICNTVCIGISCIWLYHLSTPSSCSSMIISNYHYHRYPFYPDSLSLCGKLVDQTSSPLSPLSLDYHIIFFIYDFAKGV